MKDNAGRGTEPRVSQKWEKVQENREKLSGQMEWGSLLTYSSQGIISTHQCNAIPWRCNVPREYQSLAERWRSCPESVQMWEENSTGIKPLRCFLTKQPLPLQSQVPFAHRSSSRSGEEGPNTVGLCLPALTSLGCCESSKRGEGLILFVCSYFSPQLFLRILLALQIPISQSAFFHQDGQRHSKLAAFITNAQAGWNTGLDPLKGGYAISPSTPGELRWFTTAEDPLGGI